MSCKISSLVLEKRSAEERQRIEQDLWERLRQGLPSVVFYAFGKPEDGAKPNPTRSVWGFKPAGATSDGRTGTVTVTSGELIAGRYVLADDDTWDYRVHCTQQQFVPVRHLRLGVVA